MGVGLASSDIHRVEFGDAWIECKAELSAGDMRRLRRNFIQIGPDGTPQIKGDDPEQYSWELIKVAVVKWSFVDKDGTPLPITDETIGRLTDSGLQEILKFLNELYKPISDEQKKA